MIAIEDINWLHIELSSKCQAACPMCNRNSYGGMKNPKLVLADWTLEEFKTIINIILIVIGMLLLLSAKYFAG